MNLLRNTAVRLLPWSPEWEACRTSGSSYPSVPHKKSSRLILQHGFASGSIEDLRGNNIVLMISKGISSFKELVNLLLRTQEAQFKHITLASHP